jgi:hypothetical protein
MIAVGYWAILALPLSAASYSRCSFINADAYASVVPDTLIDVFLNTSHITVDGGSEQTSALLVRPFLNFSFTQKIIVILSCHYWQMQFACTPSYNNVNEDSADMIEVSLYCYCSKKAREIGG